MNLRLWSVPADGGSQHWASCDWHGDGRGRSSAEGSDRLRWPASLIAFFAALEPNFEAACEHCLPKHDKTVNQPHQVAWQWIDRNNILLSEFVGPSESGDLFGRGSACHRPLNPASGLTFRLSISGRNDVSAPRHGIDFCCSGVGYQLANVSI